MDYEDCSLRQFGVLYRFCIIPGWIYDSIISYFGNSFCFQNSLYVDIWVIFALAKVDK